MIVQWNLKYNPHYNYLVPILGSRVWRLLLIGNVVTGERARITLDVASTQLSLYLHFGSNLPDIYVRVLFEGQLAVSFDQRSEFRIFEIDGTRLLILLTVISEELYLTLNNCDDPQGISS